MVVLGCMLAGLGAGLGGWLIWYGSQLDSRQTAQRIEDQIAELKSRATADPGAATNSPSKGTAAGKPPVVPSEAVQQIDDQFRNWAKEFLSNKERARLRFKEREIATSKKQLDMGQAYRAYYERALLNLRTVASSFKAEGVPLKVKTHGLPENIYSPFRADLLLGDEPLWAMETSPRNSAPDLPPRITLRRTRTKGLAPDYISFSFGDHLQNQLEGGKDMLTVFSDGPVGLLLNQDHTVPLDSFDHELQQILRAIVEYELTRD